MKVGKMDLPDNFKEKPFVWFKKYYGLAMKGQVSETAEEVYVMLGGKLPKNKRLMVEKSPE